MSETLESLRGSFNRSLRTHGASRSSLTYIWGGHRPGLGHWVVLWCLIYALVAPGVIDVSRMVKAIYEGDFVVPKSPGIVLPLHGLPRGTLKSGSYSTHSWVPQHTSQASVM